MYKFLFLILVIFIFSSCNTQKSIPISNSFNGNSQIEYFGFALSDCGTNYIPQIDDFVNLVDICPFDSKNIAQRIQDASRGKNKILLHLGYFFIDIEESKLSPSGMKYKLKEDFSGLFDEWLENNKNIDWSKIAAIYLPDEPNHNLMPGEDLRKIAKYIKEKIPSIPLLVIEAYSATDTIEVNEYIDWIGFDRYGTINPMTNTEYLEAYRNIKSKMNSSQKHVVVMESQWLKYYEEEGFSQDILQEMTKNYYEFAKKEGNTIAIISYLLPDNFDIEGQKGFLSLEQENQDIYINIGKEIISE